MSHILRTPLERHNQPSLFKETLMTKLIPLLALLSSVPALAADMPNPLVGTWTLVQADVILADGKQVHDYGEAPKGLLIIDAKGHYSLQIYDSFHPKYASGDRKTGTFEEFKGNAMSISAHFGTIDVDSKAHDITLHVDIASYPNQDSTTQVRHYELTGNQLSYRVEPRKDGSVPVSVWRRLE
jgi:hypothetical protein